MPLHQPQEPSRTRWVIQIQTALADCALGAIRAMAELMPAGGRPGSTADENYLGHRVMGGLTAPGVPLTAIPTAVAGVRPRALGVY